MGVAVPDTRCRACSQRPETLLHLLSACTSYAGSAYTHRHNAALRVLYFHLRHSYGIYQTLVPSYASGNLESVVENDECRIYWNYSYSTFGPMTANRPDIVLFDKSTKDLFVIEFSAPAEGNITAKEEEKLIKYQELLFKLRKLYPGYYVALKFMAIWVVGGANDTLFSELESFKYIYVTEKEHPVKKQMNAFFS